MTVPDFENYELNLGLTRLGCSWFKNFCVTLRVDSWRVYPTLKLYTLWGTKILTVVYLILRTSHYVWGLQAFNVPEFKFLRCIFLERMRRPLQICFANHNQPTKNFWWNLFVMFRNVLVHIRAHAEKSHNKKFWVQKKLRIRNVDAHLSCKVYSDIRITKVRQKLLHCDANYFDLQVYGFYYAKINFNNF
jgi:hypothetical protein